MRSTIYADQVTDVMFALYLLSSGRSGGRVVGVVAMFFILLFGIGCGIKAASSGRGVALSWLPLVLMED